MEYRNLGRTGCKVSPLCLGAMMFGAKTELPESMAMIDRAIEAGINFIDTANVYSRGKSEEFVGQALARNGKRDRIVLATKVHGKMDDADPNAWGNQRRHIVQQCDASLKRLRTDWIDLYQIHRPNSEVPIDETLRALDDLVRAGKVRYLGTSTFAAWQVMESLWVSKELGLNRFICEQPPYHLLDRRVERELVPFAQTYGHAIIPWAPLASGFLTGKYRRGEDPPKDARVQKSPGGRGDYLFTDATFAVIERLDEIAKTKGCTVSQLALAWCMNQPGITSPIFGPRTMAQLEDNLGALSVSVADEDRKKLDEVSRPGRAIVPYYEADFGPHKQRW
ncbi:MAG: aldo/keto reductase [Planctomycetes bacterium]|nr:aldo/keto reductase [Planctomycetota bacterium]